ncbi:MAG: beta-ketoacyl synthase N-terminal-like domain-containing protein, partial [Steroidobacteraceae bacterium]
MHRVAITGLGVVAPLGSDVATLFSNIAKGQSGIGPLAFPGAERLRSPIGAVADAGHMPRFEPAQSRLLDRVSQLALAASAQAISAAGIDFDTEQPERCGVSVGTSLGGAATTDAGYEVAYGQGSERIRPYSVLAAMSNAPASWIGMQHQLTGPNLTYSTACSSSAVALGEAARRIQSGDADIIIA